MKLSARRWVRLGLLGISVILCLGGGASAVAQSAGASKKAKPSATPTPKPAASSGRVAAAEARIGQLGAFTKARWADGLRGEDLANAVHKEWERLGLSSADLKALTARARKNGAPGSAAPARVERVNKFNRTRKAEGMKGRALSEATRRESKRLLLLERGLTPVAPSADQPQTAVLPAAETSPTPAASPAPEAFERLADGENLEIKVTFTAEDFVDPNGATVPLTTAIVEDPGTGEISSLVILSPKEGATQIELANLEGLITYEIRKNNATNEEVAALIFAYFQSDNPKLPPPEPLIKGGNDAPEISIQDGIEAH